MKVGMRLNGWLHVRVVVVVVKGDDITVLIYGFWLNLNDAAL